MAKVILTSKSSAMKSYIPFLSLVFVFASCTSAYKTGQTPDDVYFSPARQQDEYVRVEKQDDRQYQNEDEYRDDRYLRMKVRDRRWSTLDDGYFYGYYPSSPVLYNSSWNAINYWNVMYNPYCGYGYNTVIINNPKTAVYNKPRTFNLRVFDNTVLPTNSKGYTSTTPRTYSAPASNNNNYRNSGSNAGTFLREVFNSSGSSSGNSKTNSAPSNSNSSSSGNSSSGSSGSSRGNATRGRN
jgi:uncharacterized membrane protein YgcG